MHFCKPIEFKFAAGKQGRFRGIAASFGPTPDRQGDIILPGAFAQTLRDWNDRGANIPLLWDHQTAEPIGAVQSAQETADGLEVEGLLAEGIGNAERAMRLLSTGALSMSVGFTIASGGARLRHDGVREIAAIDLAEISLVSVPADPRAVVREVKRDIRSFETAVRDALGLSSREAKRLAAGGFAAMVRDEPPEPDTAAIDAALSRIIQSRNTR